MVEDRHSKSLNNSNGYQQYKLIFMDLNMPEMNGSEATQILRDMD